MLKMCAAHLLIFFFHTHFIIMNCPLNMATDSENSLKVSSTLIIHIQQVISIQKRMTGSKEKIQNRTVWLVVLYVYSKVVRSKQDHNSIDLINWCFLWFANIFHSFPCMYCTLMQYCIHRVLLKKETAMQSQCCLLEHKQSVLSCYISQA